MGCTAWLLRRSAILESEMTEPRTDWWWWLRLTIFGLGALVIGLSGLYLAIVGPTIGNRVGGLVIFILGEAGGYFLLKFRRA
jgi:hypothetical protein